MHAPAQIPEVAEPSTVSPQNLSIDFTVYDTAPNAYGVYRRYPTGKPSLYPAHPTADEIYNSPTFETTRTPQKRRRPSFSNSDMDSETIKKSLGPFQNATVMRLIHWVYNGTNSKSGPEIDRLVHEVLRAPDFCAEDLVGFSMARELDRLDRYQASALCNAKDGWIETSVHIPLPCEKQKIASEGAAPKFQADGVFYRKPLEIMRAALADPSIETYHWTPFQEYWKPTDDASPERIYSELYNSDAFITEHRRVVQLNAGTANSHLEIVVISIMFWSDSTHLANFGTASLWPIYMYFGNQSKYIRSKVASFNSAHHLAYIPKVQSDFDPHCGFLLIRNAVKRSFSGLLYLCIRRRSGECGCHRIYKAAASPPDLAAYP